MAPVGIRYRSNTYQNIGCKFNKGCIIFLICKNNRLKLQYPCIHRYQSYQQVCRNNGRWVCGVTLSHWQTETEGQPNTTSASGCQNFWEFWLPEFLGILVSIPNPPSNWWFGRRIGNIPGIQTGPYNYFRSNTGKLQDFYNHMSLLLGFISNTIHFQKDFRSITGMLAEL